MHKKWTNSRSIFYRLRICPLLTLIFFHSPERSRRNPIALFKFSVKIAGIQVSHFPGNIIYFHIGIQDHILRLFIFYIAQILAERTAYFFLENLAQIGGVHMILIRKYLQAKVFSVVFLDIAEDFFDHRRIVGIFCMKSHDYS